MLKIDGSEYIQTAYETQPGWLVNSLSFKLTDVFAVISPSVAMMMS